MISKILKDIFTNPDGTNFSSKRIWGGVFAIAVLVYSAYYVFTKQTGPCEPLWVMAGLVATFFGLTSVDYKSIIQNKADTGDTDPSKV